MDLFIFPKRAAKTLVETTAIITILNQVGLDRSVIKALWTQMAKFEWSLGVKSTREVPCFSFATIISKQRVKI